jgi:hypothetical protein
MYFKQIKKIKQYKELLCQKSVSEVKPRENDKEHTRTKSMQGPTGWT